MDVQKGKWRVWLLREVARDAVDDLGEFEHLAEHVWLVVLSPGCFRARSDFFCPWLHY